MRRTRGIRYIGYHAILLFFYAVASAMMQVATFYDLLPLLMLATLAFFVFPILKYATSYLAVALTVCKTE